LPLPGSTGIVPSNAPVVGSKALISLATKAEIADQQVAAELAETGRGKCDAPRRCEPAADDRLPQVPAAAR